MRNKAKLLYSCATFHKIKSISNLSRTICRGHPPDINIYSPSTAEHKLSLSLCLDSEVTDVTGHLLDAAVRRAGDLVAAKGAVEVEEDAGL